MVEMKQDLDRPFSVLDPDRLPSKHRRQRGQALLAIEQEAGALERIVLLSHGEVLLRYPLIGIPNEDRADGGGAAR